MQDTLNLWNVITTIYNLLKYGYCHLREESGAEDQVD